MCCLNPSYAEEGDIILVTKLIHPLWRMSCLSSYNWLISLMYSFLIKFERFLVCFLLISIYYTFHSHHFTLYFHLNDPEYPSWQSISNLNYGKCPINCISFFTTFFKVQKWKNQRYECFQNYLHTLLISHQALSVHGILNIQKSFNYLKEKKTCESLKNLSFMFFKIFAPSRVNRSCKV